jgi:hypothetical protein
VQRGVANSDAGHRIVGPNGTVFLSRNFVERAKAFVRIYDGAVTRM